MKTLADENKSRNPGRPPNAFRMSSLDFRRYWAKVQGERVTLSKENLLETADGFGFAGYMLNKHEAPICRIVLVPTSGKNRYYWVRLETPDGKTDFSPPVALGAEDIPRLLELWEFFEEDTLWVRDGGLHCSLLATPMFPKGWHIPGPYVVSPEKFFVLVFDEAKKALSLTTRGGIHTMRAANANFAGILCRANDLEALRAFFSGGQSIRFPEMGTFIGDVAVEKLRAIGAAYARRLLLEYRDPDMAQPFIPHTEVINMPVITVSRLMP